MNVVLEAQHACDSKLRGIGYHSLCLIQALLKRKAFDYSLTFFDYGREAGNHLRAEAYFGGYGVPMFACDELHYGIASRDDNVFACKDYNDYTGAFGDVFHFFSFITIPARLRGAMVVTVHDLMLKLHPEFIAPYSLPAFQNSFERLERIKPTVIAISHSAKREILEFTSIPEQDIHVVYQSYDEAGLYPQKGQQTVLRSLGIQGDYLFYIGVIESKKNIQRIVDAFNQIAPRFPGLQLVLGGGPHMQDAAPIYDHIRASPFADRIVLPGYVTEDQKRMLYSSALSFVFPSLHEGFGIPVLEAMACGCPVITSNTTSLPEVAGDAGILVDPRQTDEIAFAMERVVQSDSLQRKLSQKGLLQSKRFRWEKTAEQVEQVYRIAAASFKDIHDCTI